jgi:outer membrane lipoprotein LolB
MAGSDAICGGKTIAAMAICVLLTAGCSSLAPTASNGETGTTATQQSAPRHYHQSIDLAGRLSVQYQRNGNDESLHAGFTWQQTPNHSLLTLLSPLGQILATIESGPNGATLIESGQPPRSAADVDALAVQALGWPLPVSGLQLWLQGFATDHAQRKFVATPQQRSVTTQDGWHIQYPDWQAAAPSDGMRPKRIDLTRQTEQAGKVDIRIVLDRWQPQ